MKGGQLWLERIDHSKAIKRRKFKLVTVHLHWRCLYLYLEQFTLSRAESEFREMFFDIWAARPRTKLRKIWAQRGAGRRPDPQFSQTQSD